MCASYGVVLVDHVTAERPDPFFHLFLKLRRALRNADIPCAVGKVIADRYPALPGSPDDIGKCGGSLLLRGVRIGRHPVVHFGDVCRRTVRAQKLVPVGKPSFRHQLRLPFDGAPAPRDPNLGSRELLLNPGNQRVDVGEARMDWIDVMTLGMVNRACMNWFGDKLAHTL